MKNNDRIVLSILSVWTFVHFCLLGLNYKTSTFQTRIPGAWKGDYYTFDRTPEEKFYPFTTGIESAFDIRYYDFSEFAVYVLGAWLIFVLYKLNDKKNHIKN
jgi:hypothetical protein